ESLRAVGDGDVESIRILEPEALVVSVIVRDRFQTAFFEFLFYLFRIPWIDAPCESVEHRLDLRPVNAKARIRDSCGRRRGQSAPNDDAAGVLADVEKSLLAVVAAPLPVHHCCIPSCGFLVVDTLVVEVIEPHSLPTGRLKRKFQWRSRRLLPAAL